MSRCIVITLDDNGILKFEFNPKKVEDYLNRGQEVEVKIISLNKDEKKLGLALTELMEAKETAEDAE